MKSGFVASSLMALSLVAFPVQAQDNGLGVKKNNTVQVETVAFDIQAEKAIVDIINQERTDAGLMPLSVDPRLREAARGHSQDMGDVGFFDHTSPVKGKTRFTDRIKAQGLSKFGTAGENIAMGSFAPQGRAKNFMDMWMNSDGHRANILGEDYRFVGVGVYVTADGEVYATQVFSSLGEAEVVKSRPGLQIAPQQPSPEDIFGEEEVYEDETPRYTPPQNNRDDIEAKKAKIRAKVQGASGGYVTTPTYQKPTETRELTIEEKKEKIRRKLEENSEYNEEYVAPTTYYQKGTPQNQMTIEEKKAKIRRMLEEDSAPQQTTTVIIVVPQQQRPVQQRYYYTPQPTNNCR